jgi:hypothetical protein
MGDAAKVSLSLPASELRWAKRAAKRSRRSVSAVVGEAIKAARQREARSEVLRSLLEGSAPIREDELAAVIREWG